MFGRHLLGTDLASSAAAVRLLQQGAVGVSFFFVLSGFVLAWSRRPDDRPARFWQRRAARIYPAYLAACVIALLIEAVCTDQRFVVSDWRALTLTQAWDSHTHVHYGISAVNWSLSVEAFFYLVFPLLIVPAVRLPTLGRRLVLVACVVLIVGLAASQAPAFEASLPWWRIYISPLGRLPEFVIGIVLVGEVRAGTFDRLRPAVAVVLAAGAYLAAGSADLWAEQSYMWVAATVVPFALLIGSVAAADVAGRTRWLRHPALVRLGVWSYAFYLLHALVLGRVVEVSTNGYVVAAVALPLAIGAAALLHVLVEQPMERLLRPGGREAALAP